MSVQKEIKKIEKMQEKCMKLYRYLEMRHPDSYSDVKCKLACVVGAIEDLVTSYNEE